MENKTINSKEVDSNQLFKLLVIVAAILCLLFVAYILIKNQGKNDVNQQLVTVETTNVDFDQKPEKFPTNIPLEADAVITQNYNSMTPEGQFQATHQFETKKTLAENLALYTDFLKNDGWEIKASTDEPNYKMVMGSRANKAIQVTMNDSQVTQTKTVTISYSENQ